MGGSKRNPISLNLLNNMLGSDLVTTWSGCCDNERRSNLAGMGIPCMGFVECNYQLY